MNDVEYIGEFEEFKDAWDFLNYDIDVRYVWVLSENKLRYVFGQIKNTLEI